MLAGLTIVLAGSLKVQVVHASVHRTLISSTGQRPDFVPHGAILPKSSVPILESGAEIQGRGPRTFEPRTLSSPRAITKADVSYSYKLDHGSRLRGLVVLPK